MLSSSSSISAVSCRGAADRGRGPPSWCPSAPGGAVAPAPTPRAAGVVNIGPGAGKVGRRATQPAPARGPQRRCQPTFDPRAVDAGVRPGLPPAAPTDRTRTGRAGAQPPRQGLLSSHRSATPAARHWVAGLRAATGWARQTGAAQFTQDRLAARRDPPQRSRPAAVLYPRRRSRHDHGRAAAGRLSRQPAGHRRQRCGRPRPARHVRGSVPDAVGVLVRRPCPRSERRAAGAGLADACCDNWRRDDAGIWELPQERAYTTSKIGCWVALDRAVLLAEAGEVPSWHVSRWRAERAAAGSWIEEYC